MEILLANRIAGKVERKTTDSTAEGEIKVEATGSGANFRLYGLKMSLASSSKLQDT